jgi:uncharacterized protein YkwD
MILTSRLLALLLLLILIQPASSVGAGVSPRGVAGPADPPGEMPAAQAAIGYVYTLQAGDTLWDIAASHRITVEALIAANTIANPNLLRPGDRVFVPAAAVTMARKPAAPPPPPPAKPAPPPPAAQADVAPQAAPASAPLPEPTEWAALLVRLMNEKRAAAGIAPLAWSAEVAAAAQAHADDCLRRGWGSHEGSDGARIYTRLARAGYNARWAGENWVNTHSPQVAFAFWWNEPPGAAPHRSNILNPMYRDVGIGIVKVGWGYYFFVDFGSR